MRIQRIHAEVELFLWVQTKLLSMISYKNEHIMVGTRCVSFLRRVIDQTPEIACF